MRPDELDRIYLGQNYDALKEIMRKMQNASGYGPMTMGLGQYDQAMHQNCFVRVSEREECRRATMLEF